MYRFAMDMPPLDESPIRPLEGHEPRAGEAITFSLPLSIGSVQKERVEWLQDKLAEAGGHDPALERANRADPAVCDPPTAIPFQKSAQHASASRNGHAAEASADQPHDLRGVRLKTPFKFGSAWTPV
jgi:hypothetical protein